jgi:hypothetical protein
MRKIKGDVDIDGYLMQRIEALPKDMQEHFRQVVRLVMGCYGEENTPKGSAVLISAPPEDPDDPEEELPIVIISINANEITCTKMVRKANEALIDVLVADAPPKEMFN